MLGLIVDGTRWEGALAAGGSPRGLAWAMLMARVGEEFPLE